jgi:hypothetical protein
MEGREWWRSIVLIVFLLALTVLIAQSRGNCEKPGSSFVPCIFGPKDDGKHDFENRHRKKETRFPFSKERRSIL